MAVAPILKRLVSQLEAKGIPTGIAIAIATKRQQKAGNIKKGSNEATDKGERRGKMSPAERSNDRAAKDRGGKASDYKYNKHNNSSVRGKINKKVKPRK